MSRPGLYMLVWIILLASCDIQSRLQKMSECPAPPQDSGSR